jgi:hypothetical protein
MLNVVKPVLDAEGRRMGWPDCTDQGRDNSSRLAETSSTMSSVLFRFSIGQGEDLSPVAECAAGPPSLSLRVESELPCGHVDSMNLSARFVAQSAVRYHPGPACQPSGQVVAPRERRSRFAVSRSVCRMSLAPRGRTSSNAAAMMCDGRAGILPIGPAGGHRAEARIGGQRRGLLDGSLIRVGADE